MQQPGHDACSSRFYGPCRQPARTAGPPICSMLHFLHDNELHSPPISSTKSPPTPYCDRGPVGTYCLLMNCTSVCFLFSLPRGSDHHNHHGPRRRGKGRRGRRREPIEPSRPVDWQNRRQGVPIHAAVDAEAASGRSSQSLQTAWALDQAELAVFLGMSTALELTKV